MMIEEPKQVIVLRKDLGMRKGKMAAQAAHASMVAVLKGATYEGSELKQSLDTAAMEWLQGAFAKIVVGADSEQELLEIYTKAREAGINCSLIQDHGRTEFHGQLTYTAVAVGPAYPSEVNPITCHLKLL